MCLIPNIFSTAFQTSKIWKLGAFLTIILLSNCSNPQFEEPEISLDTYQIEENFKAEVLASEPLISAPVAMDFDEKGRMWIVEMNGYMPNIDGTDEEAPTGRILILEDLDKDGKIDHTKVFLDKLVLPRAIILAYGGVIYAEPPNLWFVQRKGDEPGQRQLIDNQYAIGGNVEHQPNALRRHLDNWIYSGRSTARYKKVGNKWIKEVEPLRFRGQWGLTFDDYGRFFYNDNSNPVYADFVNPNILTRNPNFIPKKGVMEWIMPDRRIWPLHATAINRGYMDGMLHENGFVANFTATCGPVIYRGDQFPEEYKGNKFVCGPEANLIKRFLISEDSNVVKCAQAYENREFLACTDEGFRPVNLYNGPDGCLYALDFHRGVIQHKIYLTSYLREKILDKKLDTIVNFGRVLRISHDGQPISEKLDFTDFGNEELVELLSHPNGWIRDKAQQFLVERNATDVVKLIENKVKNDSNNPLEKIHALWTLDGLNALSFETVLSATKSKSPKVQALSIRMMEQFYASKNKDSLEPVSNWINGFDSPETDLQLCASLGIFAAKNPAFSFQLLQNILSQNPNNELLHEAAISGLAEKEEAFLNFIKEKSTDNNQMIINYLNTVIENKNNPPKPRFASNAGRDSKSVGLDLYRTHCETCHGPSGYGVPNIAPPLYGSEWVEGDPRKLILIALHGLSGPVHVNGKLYKINNVMPGVKDHPDLTDRDLANLLTFVRNGIGKEPLNIKKEMVSEMRKVKPEGGIFTEKSLKIFLGEEF